MPLTHDVAIIGAGPAGCTAGALLAAEGLEFGACPVAAFYDDELNRLLGLDGEEESVIYLAAIGAKA